MFFYQDSSFSRLYRREKAMLIVFPRDHQGFQSSNLPFLLMVMMGTQLLRTIVSVHFEAATVSRHLHFSTAGTWLHFPEAC